MSYFDVFTVFITIAAVLNYLNFRYLRLPSRIGLMLSALVISGGLIAAGHLVAGFHSSVSEFVGRIDFRRFLLDGSLAFLLFAGALGVDLEGMLNQKKTIASLAMGGTILSALVIGWLIWAALGGFGLEVPLIYCFLFGAIISPTDPIAIIGILRDTGIPEKLESKITGESLFNDGVGVVLFAVFVEMAAGNGGFTIPGAALLFVKKTAGGILVGLITGFIAYQLLKRIDNYPVEIMLTIALAMLSYSAANGLGLSGPFSAVTAGLLTGNQGRTFAMSPQTCQNLDTFWSVLDEVLNALLFVLIGAEIIVLEFRIDYFAAGAIAIPVVLLARWASVSLPIGILKIWEEFSPDAIKILTWGGLRGGIAVALALSVPDGPYRGLILAMTYGVVVFSVLVQGLTIEPLIRRWERKRDE